MALAACHGTGPHSRTDFHQTPIDSQCGVGDAHSEPPPRFRLLGEIRWPQDTRYGGILVGGLSSIDHDPQTGDYVMVSDDRATHGPARYYTARIDYDASGLHDVQLTGMYTLRSPTQQLYRGPRDAQAGTAVPDPEALRIIPGTRRMVWSTEGDFQRGFGPEIHEADLAGGQWQRSWPLPKELQLPVDRSQATVTGPRSNFTLEGLSFSEDGKALWISMEGPLKQDGPMPSPGRAGGPVRITALDAATRQPLRQLAYQPDELLDTIWIMKHRAVLGVSEILADGPDHLLVLERSFAVAEGFGARIYRISTRMEGPHAPTNTLGMPKLESGSVQVATKQLVADLGQVGLHTVDNIEGMAWGPRLPGGERVLLLVSDNNFNPAEVTQFIALAETRPCTAR